MEYFELVEKNYWIGRFLKKPKREIIETTKKNIIEKNRIITIGISKNIINKIINEYLKELKKCSQFGRYKTDYNDICTRMQLPRDLIILVLERKNIIITKSKLKKVDKNE
jgi:hypothetical protein